MEAERRTRLRAPFWTQAGALARKNFAFQKRRWLANAFLLAAPFFICMLLWVLQEVINKQLDTRDFRCGCKCLSCCAWVPAAAPGANGTASTAVYVYECYDATDDRPCSPYADCKAYNDTECGYLYSTADQVGFCSVQQPPLWPALLPVPLEKYRGPKYPAFDPEAIPSPQVPLTDAAMLYIGDNPATADQLMQAMWARPSTIRQAAVRAYLRAQASGQAVPSSTENQTIGSELEFVEATGALAQGLLQFGLVMGTSAMTSVSNLMEPAFLAQKSDDDSGMQEQPALYFAQPNCSALSAEDAATLAEIGEAITNMTGFPVHCASLPAVRQLDTQLVGDQVFCGWHNSDCVVRSGAKVEVAEGTELTPGNASIQEYVSALFDWHGTDRWGLNVSVWVNNTNIARETGPPDVQRWNQPLNLAANAYLRWLKGSNYSVPLVGVKDMPKGASRLSLDFSSLLGPLFIMWFMQLLLPVNVYTIVHEKEAHLRTMMRMQGLNDTVYYVVQYLWMLAMYCVFMAIFVGFGSAIGLKIFTKNSYSVQFVFYFLWGNLLSSWSLLFSAIQSETRPAVLLAVVWVIISGFVANLVLVQYIERGPNWLAKLLSFVPSFGLFSGLYELSQYAFLADRTGGSGLTWSKLLDDGNNMVLVWVVMAIEWYCFPFDAYYIDQVTGAGSGVKRHPLFMFGVRYQDQLTGKSRWVGRWLGHTKTAALPSSKDASQDSPASGLTVAGGSPLTPVQKPAEDDNLDYYYGRKLGGFGSPQPMSPASPGAEPSAATPSAGTGSHALHLSLPPGSPDDPASPWAASPGQQEGPDVAEERVFVERLWSGWQRAPEVPPPAAILLHQLRKVYPAATGGRLKVAVEGLSLEIQRCECFGLLGPNGAGKTTTIRMMEGFLDPTAGDAIIEGFSIRDDMDSIYTLMGACPQHDLLWEGLTGREHLLFYARVKNLAGRALRRAVDKALHSVNLFAVGDQLVSSYSGGMKRRLSVAIALVGDPLVVYLDEPSTGLDPSSRRLLWDVIKKARKDKAVVLTTHSMEEAEALCDRLGIFVGGRLQCLGNPKDLTARFGDYLSFTLTTPQHQAPAALAAVRTMCPGARPVYSLGGTQKFELPAGEVEVDAVFRHMEWVKASGALDVLDWGVSNATLEEVFIRVTREAGVRMSAFA